MSEAKSSELAFLRGKLKDLRADNEHLMAQNTMLRETIVNLQNDVFQLRAALRGARSETP